MTTRNNFDESSSGTDIECTVFYDTDRSQMDFRDNFKILQYSGYSQTAVCYYIDNGNLPDDSEIKFTVKGTREAKIKYLSDFYDDVENWTEEDMNAEIIAREEDVNLINYALDRLPDIAGLEFIPNKELETVATTGYSQGDYAVVIYCPEDMEKVWGNKSSKESLQKIINHYYWDSPIYATCRINGEEYSYWDMPEYDEYEWEKDKFIAYVAKESGIDPEKLESIVPDQPDYS